MDVKLAYDGRTWQPDVTVQCHGVDFCYFKFPYRLEHGTGEVTLKHDAARKNNVLTVGVTAFSGEEEVRIDGEIHRPGPDWNGQFVIRSSNLPVDKKLLDALPQKPREIVGSLHPSYGNINVLVRYSRDALPNAQLDRYIKVDVNNGSIKYERFAYPLSNVRGTLEISERRSGRSRTSWAPTTRPASAAREISSRPPAATSWCSSSRATTCRWKKSCATHWPRPPGGCGTTSDRGA